MLSHVPYTYTQAFARRTKTYIRTFTSHTIPLTIPFLLKSINPFCFVCAEHCWPGAVWEIENAGHGLIWPCDAGEAQRNRTALCHEDPQQAEGQSGSGVRRVTVGWRVFKCVCHLRIHGYCSYRMVIENMEMSLMWKLYSQSLRHSRTLKKKKKAWGSFYIQVQASFFSPFEPLWTCLCWSGHQPEWQSWGCLYADHIK